MEHDRVNAVLRYTFLSDQPGADQVGADGTTGGDMQQSHILSADAIIEATETIEIGAKVAYCFAETAARGTDDWQANDAALAALRANYPLTHAWDLGAEVRHIEMFANERRETGALVSAHRHLNESTKIGVGYTFGSFSDDLRDLTQDDHGLFFNVFAKF